MKFRLSSGTGIFFATAFVIIGFIFSWHFFGRMNPYDSLMPGNQADAAIPIELSDVEVHTRDAGLLTGKLHAASLIISPDRRTIDVTNLTSGVLYKGETPVLFFSAPHVEYASSQFYTPPSLVVDNGIKIWTKSPLRSETPNVTISTREVNWSGETSIATCTTPVFFSANNLGSGSASGLTIDTKRNNIQFGSITATTNAKLVDDDSPNNSAAGSPSKPEAPETDDNVVTYQASDGYWDGNERMLTVKGAVTFHQGKADVKMVGATYDRQTDTAVSSSPVTIADTDTTVTGDNGSINFSTHIANLLGHIKMVILPKPDDKVSEPETKKPTTIYCDQINYNYRVKKAQTTGKVLIEQPTTGRTVTADQGSYDAVLKIVDLTGNVVGKSKDGKLVKSPQAELSVDPKDEWLKLTGPIVGSMKVSDQDNPLASSVAPAKDSGKTTAENTPTAPTSIQK